MPGSTGAGLDEADREVVAEVGRRYDSNEHLAQPAAHSRRRWRPTSSTASPSSGRRTACADRLRELADLGVDRFVITGASFGADRDHARTAARLVADELLPELRERAAR